MLTPSMRLSERSRTVIPFTALRVIKIVRVVTGDFSHAKSIFVRSLPKKATIAFSVFRRTHNANHVTHPCERTARWGLNVAFTQDSTTNKRARNKVTDLTDASPIDRSVGDFNVKENRFVV